MKKLIPLMVLLTIPTLKMMAQEGKLKTVQATSVWAPANLKVDGSLKEWDDTFQAYNKATKIFYTMSNDDKYLYLVVKSIDITNNAKIIAGGITLTINTEGKKKDKDAYTLTYPVIPRQQGRNRGGGGGGGRGGGGGFGGGGDRRGQAPDSATIAAQRKNTVEAAKEIKVLGFKAITDTTISIYNEFSIKAALGYDAIGNYDYELAVPLTLLNISPANAKEFAYNIKVNGIQLPPNLTLPGADGGQGGAGGGFGGAGGGAGGAGAGGGGGGGGRGGRGGGGGGGNPGAATPRAGGAPGGRNMDPEMFAPTDFWGKYTLAKK